MLPENEKVINNYIKTYLIGPIEKVQSNDFGRGWREKITKELDKRVDPDGNPVHVFDPTLEESQKVGYPAKEFHAKMEGWIASGNIDKVREGMDIIWRGKTYTKPIEGVEGQAETIHIMGDIDYLRNSDFIIARLEEGDHPCGTYFEAGLCFERRIPIYLIKTMALSKYNKSFLGWVLGSNGEIFDNNTQLLEFVDKKYKLKIRKDK